MRSILAILLLLGVPAAARAQPETYGVELFSGAPLHLNAPLEIRQEAELDLDFTGVYRTEPFTPPIYWALRVSWRAGGEAWSLELMHHKVYLDDPPPEVQSFGVSHGFNFITVQRAWPHRLAELRAGAGIVLGHPESTVRGRRYDESQGLFSAGYHVAGPAALVAAGRRWSPRPWLTLALEARLSVAPARVPIAGGDARFTNVALHVMGGVGLLRAAE